MLAPRYRMLWGLITLIGPLFLAAAAMQLLEGRSSLKPGVIGTFVAGVTMFCGDIAVRRFSGERRIWARYLGNQSAMSLRGIVPIWLIGFTLLVVALSMPA